MLHCYVYSTINKSSMSMSKVKGSLTRVIIRNCTVESIFFLMNVVLCS